MDKEEKPVDRQDSVQIGAWKHALRSGVLTTEAQVVWSMLIAHTYRADADECFPSIKTLKRLTKMGQRRVQLGLKQLQDLGIIGAEVKPVPRGAPGWHYKHQHPDAWRRNEIRPKWVSRLPDGTKPATPEPTPSVADVKTPVSFAQFVGSFTNENDDDEPQPF